MRDDVSYWWRTAESDFKMAEVLEREKLFAGSAFHLQQAAEKSLKALLLVYGETEPTHSGRFLMRKLSDLGEVFPDGTEHALRKLDRSFIDSRYPNGAGGAPEDLYDAETVRELKRCCQIVMAFVKSRLS